MISQQTRILCVDDDPVSLKLLRHVLSPWACDVLEAESGEEALEVIARENVDLVLLDIVLPGMNGYDVCKTIKGNERTRNIPIVMVTGLLSKEDRIKGIEAGAEEFLTKPFDEAEVRARIKMLLKAKRLHERRTGEILIELGLINEEQLQAALKISKEKHLKVGEALYSMGALSRDTIYWGLSNQLQMTYVEVSPEMVDRELIQKFPLDVLKKLQCLPLYETNVEIHFAVADPTDRKNVAAIESLMPGKAIQLHLGLPEKIADVLGYYGREFVMPSSSAGEPPSSIRSISVSPDDGIQPRAVLDAGKYWDDLAAALLSMPSDAVCWLHKTFHRCRLLAKNDSTFEVAREYPAEVYSLFQERTSAGRSPRFLEGGIVTVLADRSHDRQAAFKVWPVDAVDGGLARIERIPAFSTDALERSHPLASSLIAETRSAFEEHRRLVVGGPDRLFIKQVCYSLLIHYVQPADFPPVFFLERAADIYLPKAAQLSSLGWDLGAFLESIGEEVAPFVFYEAGSPEAESVEACLSGFASGRLSNVILGLRATSARTMREALKKYGNRPPRVYKAVFIDASRLKRVG